MRRVVVLLALFATPALFAQSSPVYRITHTYTLGGDGRWDYIVPDPPRTGSSSAGRIASWRSTKTPGSFSVR